MTRYGTLLGLHGKPTDRVIIVRKGPKTTRVKLPWPDKPGFNPDEVRVDTDTVLDDGGTLWKKYQHTPHAATWLSYSGQPQGLLHVQRIYKNVIKASLYEGNGSWSVVEDFHPNNVRFDAGEGWPKARTDELVTSTAQQPASVATPTTLAPPVKKGPVFHAPTTNPTPAPQPATRPAARSPQQSLVTTPPTPKTKPTKAIQPATTPTPPAPKATASGQRVGYLRVSSTDQNLARQREALGVLDREFVDELSARSRAHRPGLEECLAYLRTGDELVVASIDRLARSLVDLRTIIDQVTAKGASVHFLKEGLMFSATDQDPRATLMLGILGSFAEFERSIIRERQAEGITLAKKAGKFTGRKRALSPEQVEHARMRVEAGETKTAIAQDLGVGRATLHRALAK
ncbi:recombinase family protein [Corynebacterium glutamicum]|uniref:recombinase family protein n=1 Tax=Corynebacterium glutamicum TaxID=1718 RepID=UPI0011B42F75|nr:recombinase family protein [Corynebacterium glutamicum]TWS33151.1 res protein [Corynebacterium glutamicum]TWS40651.1 res protein [Corynebacterium glutamicum]TWS46618.1 res protein [Corynebacterium glutamicum]TWS52739.1 res protein [Corynebacterium glutamicum]